MENRDCFLRLDMIYIYVIWVYKEIHEMRLRFPPNKKRYQTTNNDNFPEHMAITVTKGNKYTSKYEFEWK